MSKFLKTSLTIILTIVLFLIFVVGGYVLYLCLDYYRIPDHQVIEIENNTQATLSLGNEYSISSFNIGFGAYSQDFSFFMDSGELLDGTKTKGTGSTAKSRESVLQNTIGATNVIKNLNTDFSFFQEVDINSTRSHKVNQYQTLSQSFQEYSNSKAINFHSGFLFYPFSNPHGKSESSIATFSKYKIENAERRAFPVDESFPTKFFDLDRCFAVYKLPILGTDKKLVLINLHMSAYDEGGKIRAKQLDMLSSLVTTEYQNGNYVIAGGDWNHDIASSENLFKTGEKKPDWVGKITDEDIPNNFSFAKTTEGNTTVPTCRSSDIPYTKQSDGSLLNYTIIIDGFLVSDNITVTNLKNIDTEFSFSDHNPCLMKFVLN